MKRDCDFDRGLACAATLIIGLLVAHSLVDYPLRSGAMMGIMAFACALLVEPPLTVQDGMLVRPGLTGWGQVKGGRVISAADKAALDVWYVLNASLRLDALILLKTMRMVLFGERVNAAAIHRAWRELRQAGVCALPETAELPGGFVTTK